MAQSPESNRFVQEVFSTSSGTPIRKRGQWNNARRLAAIDAMLHFRPFQQKQRKKGPAWSKIFDSVNNVCPDLKPLGRSAIREQINKLILEAEENSLSSSYVFETLLERQALKLFHLMEKDPVRRNSQQHENNSTEINNTTDNLLPIHINSQSSSVEEPIHPERDFQSALIDIKENQEKQTQQLNTMISHISNSDDTLKQISLQLQIMTQQQHLFFSYMSKKIEEMTPTNHSIPK